MRSFAFPLVAVALLTAAPASAAWRKIEAAQPVTVAKSGLTVTPAGEWNRSTSRPIKDSEIWTLDGATLNEFYFIGELPDGKPMYRELDKKDNPLPKFASNMLPTDLVDFFETSTRSALGTSMFELSDVRPAKIGPHDAVRFDFSFAVQGDELLRKGVTVMGIIGGQLYLASFSAPAIYYYDRDYARAEKLLDTLTITTE